MFTVSVISLSRGGKSDRSWDGDHDRRSSEGRSEQLRHKQPFPNRHSSSNSGGVQSNTGVGGGRGGMTQHKAPRFPNNQQHQQHQKQQQQQMNFQSNRFRAPAPFNSRFNAPSNQAGGFPLNQPPQQFGTNRDRDDRQPQQLMQQQPQQQQQARPLLGQQAQVFNPLQGMNQPRPGIFGGNVNIGGAQVPHLMTGNPMQLQQQLMQQQQQNQVGNINQQVVPSLMTKPMQPSQFGQQQQAMPPMLAAQNQQTPNRAGQVPSLLDTLSAPGGNTTQRKSTGFQDNTMNRSERGFGSATSSSSAVDKTSNVTTATTTRAMHDNHRRFANQQQQQHQSARLDTHGVGNHRSRFDGGRARGRGDSRSQSDDRRPGQVHGKGQDRGRGRGGFGNRSFDESSTQWGRLGGNRNQRQQMDERSEGNTSNNSASSGGDKNFLANRDRWDSPPRSNNKIGSQHAHDGGQFRRTPGAQGSNSGSRDASFNRQEPQQYAATPGMHDLSANRGSSQQELRCFDERSTASSDTYEPAPFRRPDHPTLHDAQRPNLFDKFRVPTSGNVSTSQASGSAVMQQLSSTFPQPPAFLSTPNNDQRARDNSAMLTGAAALHQSPWLSGSDVLQTAASVSIDEMSVDLLRQLK